MSITILIADDEERWRRIVGDFLRNEGYRVLEAADGQQVMELMRSEEKIDLVVLDIMMPVLDGLETCRLIRKRSAVPVMIKFSDIFRVVWKETRVALLCGLTLAAVNFVKLIFLSKVTVTVAAVICLTLVFTVFVAKIVGCTLPILAKRVGGDPAVMASPFLTTIVDALSLVIYFEIAGVLLHI